MTNRGGEDQEAPAPDLVTGEVPAPAPGPPLSGRRAEIVAGARRLLEEEGPGAVTMRRLAEDLGIRAPSLYKHFPSKAAVELALVEQGLFEVGEVSHAALHEDGSKDALARLLADYRGYCLAHPNLYRLATGRELERSGLPDGLEEWAGNPWFVVTGDPFSAQALWAFAHGMVMLELDRRFPPGSDLDRSWGAGARAFRGAPRAHAQARRGRVPPT